MTNSAATLEIIQKHQKHSTDTGSTHSQCAIFSHRINYLTKHLEIHRKDHAAKLGLRKLVGQRKRLLAYLKAKDVEGYRQLISALGIRK